MKKILFFVVLCCSVATIKGHSDPVFIPNLGQWKGGFSHKAQFGNLSVFATAKGFRYLVSEEIPHHMGHQSSEADSISMHAFSLNLLGSDSIYFKGLNLTKGIHNYFRGNDPDKWITRVPLFEGVYAKNVYPGIDLHAYSSEESFKYDFILEPGADPSSIELNYSGCDQINIEKGSVEIITSLGTYVESIPVSYQFINNQKVKVECEYIKLEGGFGFQFPNGYDREFPLYIDPVLVAATLSGTTGSNQNFGHGATFDLAGNIYTQGISFDSSYPTDEGSFQQFYGGGVVDAVISKLTTDGTDLIYATFLGGEEREYPLSSVVNGNEELYVFGITDSPNYPVSSNAFQPDYAEGGEDMFITALSADGSEIIGSTYIGGSGFDGRNFTGAGVDNYTGEIELNIDGEVYIASCSSSEDFPITAGAFQEEKQEGQDGVLLKMNADLSGLIWSTFIGSEGGDMAYSVSIQEDQTLYVAGSVSWNNQTGTGGEGFVTTLGAFQDEFSGLGANDGFVIHLESDGSELISSSLLGLENDDKAYFVDIDSNGDVWILMQSTSPWQVTDGVWGTGSGNLCVHKMSPDLSELLLTSFLTTGTSGGARPTAFLIDNCNRVYFSGFFFEGSADFIASEDALFQTGGFYVGVFTPDMEDLEYGTYYTGNHVDGGTSRFDEQGIIYQGVCSCEPFNTTDDAWATTSPTQDCDVAVFKIDLEAAGVFASAGAAGFLTGCAPHTVAFSNFSTGETFEWDFDKGLSSDEFEPTITFTEPGEYLVQLVVFDPESCNLTDTALVPITVLPEVDFFADFSFNIDCESGELQITDQSQGPVDIEYEWDMGDGTILTDTNPTYIYNEAGTYTVTLTLSSEACNQEMMAEQTIEYAPFLEADFDFQIADICESFLVIFTNQSEASGLFSWDLGDGTTLDESGNFEYTYDEPGLYTIELIVQDENSCNQADTLSQIIEIEAPPVLDPQISIAQTGLCEDLSYTATVNPNGPVESQSWLVNGQFTSSELQLNSTVESPGEYTIQVIIIDPVCQEEWTTEVEFEFFENLGFELPPNLTLCPDDISFSLDATVAFDDAIYDWNNGFFNEPVLEVLAEGTYTATVSFNGCSEIQETDVDEVPELPLAFEALICEGQPNQIDFQDPFGLIEQVNWADGQTGFEIEVNEAGYYPFSALDIFGCNQVDSLLTVARDDDPNIEIPNVFTPNGDGFNDFFEIQSDELVFFELEIYDRWGKQVYKSNDINSNWDGTYSTGSGSRANTFSYILKYRDLCDLENQVMTGTLQILK